MALMTEEAQGRGQGRELVLDARGHFSKNRVLDETVLLELWQLRRQQALRAVG